MTLKLFSLKNVDLVNLIETSMPPYMYYIKLMDGGPSSMYNGKNHG